MTKFLKILTSDPILALTAFIFAAVGVILVWAVMEYKGLDKRQGLPNSPHHPPERNPNHKGPISELEQVSEFVLLEAGIRDLSAQIAELSRKVSAVEKSIHQKAVTDQTIPAMSSSAADLEKFVQRIEKRLELLSSDKGTGISGDALSKLEAKVEGIHKLLILLTDSGTSETK